MVPISTLLAWMEARDRQYWLRRCQGFEVRGQGRRLGVVEDVRYRSSRTQPDRITFRSGLLRRHRWQVPARAVAVVDPREHTLWIDPLQRRELPAKPHRPAI